MWFVLCAVWFLLCLVTCRYGWKQHNGDNFGIQEILDTKQNLNLTTIFMQPVHSTNGSSIKDRWSTRIVGTPIKKRSSTDSDAAISLFWYISLTDSKHSFSTPKTNKKGWNSKEDINIHIHTNNDFGDLILSAHAVQTLQHPAVKLPSAKKNVAPSNSHDTNKVPGICVFHCAFYAVSRHCQCDVLYIVFLILHWLYVVLHCVLLYS